MWVTMPSTGHSAWVSWALILAGVLPILHPVIYRRQVGKIHERLRDRGGDAGRFDAEVHRPRIRASLWIAPLVGVVVLVTGLI